MARTWRLFYTPSLHFWGMGERKSVPGRRGSFLATEDGEGSGQVLSGVRTCV